MGHHGVVIGVDGGGSSTKALAATGDGTVIGYGESGPSNCQTVGVNQAGQTVLAACRKAMGNGELNPVTYFLGLAGTGRPEDKAKVRSLFEELVKPARVTLETDAYIALASGTLCQPGVVIIAGTGSIAFGIDPSGREARSGGWGYLLGDEGSAFDIGRQGVRAVLRESDGRGPATSLTESFLKHLGVTERAGLSQIVRQIYQQDQGHRQLAVFSQLVTREAHAGDRVALGIIKRAAWELSTAARAVLKQLALEPGSATVIITGGIFDSEPLLAKLFIRYLNRRAPGFSIARPRFKPVVGALLLALKQINGNLSEALVRQMEATLPENLLCNETKMFI
ncbi:MAG TPA: BadF/BadG/BcrA/BcrD ATPase family protein [Bacillota bacterium]|nr:BadF/BadG/BcrA/BcrD ATPase family protein [Bacillota bacterium]